YYHQDEKTLNYAERDNADEPWRNEQVAWGLEVGMGSRMRLDDKGRPHIFYYTANGKFMHAWREGPNAWQKNIVENATGGFSTITALEWRNNGFWISFLDAAYQNTRILLAQPQPGVLKEPADKPTATHNVELHTISEKR